MSAELPVLKIPLTEDLRHCIERRQRIIDSVDSTQGNIPEKQFNLLLQRMEAENTKIVRMVMEQYRKEVIA